MAHKRRQTSFSVSNKLYMCARVHAYMRKCAYKIYNKLFVCLCERCLCIDEYSNSTLNGGHTILQQLRSVVWTTKRRYECDRMPNMHKHKQPRHRVVIIHLTSETYVLRCWIIMTLISWWESQQTDTIFFSRFYCHALLFELNWRYFCGYHRYPIVHKKHDSGFLASHSAWHTTYTHLILFL